MSDGHFLHNEARDGCARINLSGEFTWELLLTVYIMESEQYK